MVLPKSLRAECDRAAAILRDFTIPNSTSSVDRIISPLALQKAKGFAILTFVKAGFLISLRAGNGVVVVRNGREWTAPSIVGLGGIGGGLEIGVEVTNLVILLNNDRAVSSFKKGGNVTIGGGLSIAAGPVGRRAEGDFAVRNAAAFYSYSKSKGLFAGISLEAATFVERKGANKKVYGKDVRARDLLNGLYAPPKEAANLYKALNECCSYQAGIENLTNLASNYTGGRSSSGNSSGSSVRSRMPSFRRPSISGSKSRNANIKSSPVSKSSGTKSGGKSYYPKHAKKKSVVAVARTTVSSSSSYGSSSYGTYGSQQKTSRSMTSAPSNSANDVDWSAEIKCQAEFAFKGEKECDLSFSKGAIITVLTRTNSQDDWWEGQIYDRIGIFPANYVKML